MRLKTVRQPSLESDSMVAARLPVARKYKTVSIHFCLKRLISTIWGFLSPCSRCIVVVVVVAARDERYNKLYDHFHIAQRTQMLRVALSLYLFCSRSLSRIRSYCSQAATNAGEKNWDVSRDQTPYYTRKPIHFLTFDRLLHITFDLRKKKTAGHNNKIDGFYVCWQDKMQSYVSFAFVSALN